MGARSGGIGRQARAGAYLFAGVAATACGSDTTADTSPPISEGTVIGTITGTGGVPLDSVRIELTVPSQLDLYTVTGGGGISDASGRFSVPVSLLSAPDPA